MGAARLCQRAGDAANAGFTLLEMLLALTLMAMITGALVGGLRLGQRAWETSRRDETRGEVEAAARAISQMLTRAWPAVARKARAPQAAAATGTRRTARAAPRGWRIKRRKR